MNFYHRIALNLPLPRLFTYACDRDLPVGTRVAVTFRGRATCGVLWQNNVSPELAADKILPVERVFSDRLPQSFLNTVAFAARYYHYPVGAALFAALPPPLRLPRPAPEVHPETLYVLSEAGMKQAPPAHHKRLFALWQALSREALNQAQMRKIHPGAKDLAASWQERGLLRRVSEAAIDFAEGACPLNPEQARARDEVCATLGGFAPFLLYGVTGSGKTETYFEIMAEVLRRGEQALFLLPEVALGGALWQRLHRRFPKLAPALMTSRSADGSRARDFLLAASGSLPLLVGTRLSVFTPMPRLGLIIVDEEHDDSYKQNEELRYNARDLAVWRAKKEGCPIVLGSATPSLESFVAAEQNRYRPLRLNHRAKAESRLPEIIIDDMRGQKPERGIGRTARQMLSANLAAGGVSLVYINRRGFAPVLLCTECGYGFSCPHCSAHMVLHRRDRQLRCHHCDYRLPLPEVCPDCGNTCLSAVGQGTQRVEETMCELFPTARIARIDRDSTMRKGDWEEFYRRMGEREIDILVGTQMLAKGHDFPRLNLVLVLAADGSLYSADIRAEERLFAELMQVSGRAGRDKTPGRVLIQTRLPEHPLFRALAKHDFFAFARGEAERRRAYGAPPFSHAVAVRADAPILREAMDFLRAAAASCPRPESVRLFGPAPQLMVRLKGRERARLFLESPNRADLHRTLDALEAVLARESKKNRALRYAVDVDPGEP